MNAAIVGSKAVRQCKNPRGGSNWQEDLMVEIIGIIACLLVHYGQCRSYGRVTRGSAGVAVENSSWSGTCGG
jgi:hypothetical protein